MASYAELVRTNRSFRLLWSAEVVSFLGDWFNTIAVYAIVAELSGSGRAFAGVLVAKMLPIFLITPIAGPIVDRFDRRTLMIAADVVRAVLAFGLVYAHRAESLPALYVCLIAMVIASGLSIPAQRAALPQITSAEELAPANALSGGTWSVMLAFGAAAGGWVAARFGVDTALVLDSLTFVVSAVFLVFLPALPAPGREGSAASRSFVAGLRYLASHRRTAALASLKPLMALGGAAITLIPVFGTSVFPGQSGPQWIGLLYSGRGLGALVGSMALIRIFGDRSRTLRRLVLAAFPLAALSYLGLAEADSAWMATVFYFTGAVASGANWVLSTTLLQREADPRFLGRVFAVEFGLMTLAFSAVAWGTGTALDQWSVSPAALCRVAAAALAIPFLFWGTHLLRERRRAAEEGAGAPRAMSPGAVPEVFEEAAEDQPSSR